MCRVTVPDCLYIVITAKCQWFEIAGSEVHDLRQWHERSSNGTAAKERFLLPSCSVLARYGGELLEVIRFIMEADNLQVGDSMESYESYESYQQEWAEEVAALEALPYVKNGSVNFVASEASANLNKV